MIKYIVNGDTYNIPEDCLTSFPIQTSYLNVLYSKYKNRDCLLKVTENDEIIINSEYHNFDKIAKLYLNHHISVYELFDFRDITEKIRCAKVWDEIQALSNWPKFMFLKKDNYEVFLQELAFYGIEKLPQFCSLSEICLETFVRRLKRAIRNITVGANLADDYDFIGAVKRFGGCISGSFVLKTILKEQWEHSDFDIYFDKTRFDKNIEDFYNKTDGVSLLNTCEAIQKIFGVSDACAIGQNLDGGYGVCHELSHVIRAKLGDLKVDFCMLRCTVPYFIQNFDFQFNTVYYDGHALHAFDWGSIVTRTSPNSYKADRYNISEIDKYWENIERIEKYFKRGFVITYYEENRHYVPEVDYNSDDDAQHEVCDFCEECP